MNIMLDLETLSSRSDAAIVAIGAATFHESTYGQQVKREKFYITVCPVSSQAAGGHISAETVQWWSKQPYEARKVLCDSESARLLNALWAFKDFCNGFDPAIVWGNSSSFDCVILRQAYERLGMKAPWSYRNERCYRTLKNLRPDIAFDPYGVAHNALDDAIAQAEHAERILAALSNQG